MFSTRLTLVTVALYLGFAINVPGQAQTQSNSASISNKLENSFSPPSTDKPTPENRQGGASRGPKLASEGLTPQEQPPTNNCVRRERSPEQLAPNNCTPNKVVPKPLTSSPTDLTNW
ncbi:MAG TPA: hypothetical protein V6D11_23255 [Waterburya sp.]|jgi:hypothetical protein